MTLQGRIQGGGGGVECNILLHVILDLAATITSKLVFNFIKSECITAQLQFHGGNEPMRGFKKLVKTTQHVLSEITHKYSRDLKSRLLRDKQILASRYNINYFIQYFERHCLSSSGVTNCGFWKLVRLITPNDKR